ncbi:MULTISPECIES: DUF3303 family protein [Streptomyces]|uniref:Uncharacterized protein n=1 Tax=Streptomyces fuscus TaxID=3048495 RepID=A0ABT7IS96_9ACTN|nr:MULTISPECIES: DUF3303 family protein [Streptomyces]MCM1976230.1 hypothetical protein [Streptomyces sp. G1]MDL2075457.1 hypothetical protein [Streptomyces fuscus]SBT93679.1 hypothetical protein GA0115233_10695 [Streptomyces sp. DI166]
MRTMMKVTVDTDKGNEAIRSGRLPEIMKGVLEKLKPEAAYFGPEGGQRTCWMVFDLQDSSQLPPTAEPFFEELRAKVELTPVMNIEDLQKGLSQLSGS